MLGGMDATLERNNQTIPDRPTKPFIPRPIGTLVAKGSRISIIRIHCLPVARALSSKYLPGAPLDGTKQKYYLPIIEYSREPAVPLIDPLRNKYNLKAMRLNPHSPVFLASKHAK